jgi:hypothetical protein
VKVLEVHRRHERQDDMIYKRITHTERKSVYIAGRQSFREYTPRGYNPHTRSNLTLSLSWWHGWDTASEESDGQGSPPAKPDEEIQLVERTIDPWTSKGK